MTKDNKRMKEVYKLAEKLTADYQDSRIMGIIRESGSKMYMGEKNWEKALTEFFETFRCY
jgi:COP9 signalosome complex subunit 2